MYNKFKAKATNLDKYVIGSLVNIQDYYYIIENCDSNQLGELIPVEKETVETGIGYRDKNDKEIFSGDLVRFSNFESVLIWFCRELNCLVGTRFDDDLSYNGVDFFDPSTRLYDFAEVCVMPQDLYGDFNGDIEIVRSYNETPELFHKALSSHIYNLWCETANPGVIEF